MGAGLCGGRVCGAVGLWSVVLQDGGGSTAVTAAHSGENVATRARVRGQAVLTMRATAPVQNDLGAGPLSPKNAGGLTSASAWPARTIMRGAERGVDRLPRSFMTVSLRFMTVSLDATPRSVPAGLLSIRPPSPPRRQTHSHDSHAARRSVPHWPHSLQTRQVASSSCLDHGDVMGHCRDGCPEAPHLGHLKAAPPSLHRRAAQCSRCRRGQTDGGARHVVSVGHSTDARQLDPLPLDVGRTRRLACVACTYRQRLAVARTQARTLSSWPPSSVKGPAAAAPQLLHLASARADGAFDALTEPRHLRTRSAAFSANGWEARASLFTTLPTPDDWPV